MMWKEKTDQKSAADLVVGFIQLLSQSSAILAGAVKLLVHGFLIYQQSPYETGLFLCLCSLFRKSIDVWDIITTTFMKHE